MTETPLIESFDLELRLREALAAHSSASIRPVGSVRLLGDLHLKALTPGISLELAGAKGRDQVPDPGRMVMVSLLVGEQVLSFEARVLASQAKGYQPAPILVAWPLRGELRRRMDIRVATPDLPSLCASIVAEGRSFKAQVLNLTETGLGLGLVEQVMLGLHTQVEVSTQLPGCEAFQATGSVRHVEWIDGDALPTRIGLVLGCMTDQAREAMRAFIQVRRTDRSENLRQGN